MASPDRFVVVSASALIIAGLLIVGLVEVASTDVHVAGGVTAVLAAAGPLGWQARHRLRAHRKERRDLAVSARTADELTRLAGDRWTVRHGVPVGEGRTAHLVADRTEVHLLLAVWIPPRDAALHLRCAVATAHAAARELQTLDAAGGRGRTVTAGVVAWGRAAGTARDRQTRTTAAAVLLPAELWTWRVARSRPCTDAVRDEQGSAAHLDPDPVAHAPSLLTVPGHG